MAKWDERLAGSSMHIHLSLWDQDGQRPCFPGDQQSGPLMAGDTFRWFLGGWMAHARELIAFYAPSVNSYKRYQEGSFAPTGIAWSYDNRTAGFRIVAMAPPCASSAAYRAPTRTPTWPTRRQAPPD